MGKDYLKKAYFKTMKFEAREYGITQGLGLQIFATH